MASEFIIRKGFKSRSNSTITGTLIVSGNTTSNSFIKNGGTSSQFLKADGTIDTNSYLTSANLGTSEQDTTTSSGGETTFVLSGTISQTYPYFIYINGVLQHEGAAHDYTLTNAAVTTINFNTALVTDDFIDVYYNSGNSPNTIVFHDSTAVASATSAGVKGEIRTDANYIYVCTADNVWKRSSLSTW